MNIIWHYDKIYAYNQRKYANILTAGDITGDMIARKVKDGIVYYYPFKKGQEQYLVPTEEDTNIISLLPVKIIETVRDAYRGKGYLIVTKLKPVEVKAEKTMTYKEFIDSFMDFAHKSPDEFKLWKIIVDTAYCDRINVRVTSYPSWLKDSTLGLIQHLRGDAAIVNKPTYAKVKYLLTAKMKVIGLNEVQNVDTKEKRPLEKTYEDLGDFKPRITFDSRSTIGTSEHCDVDNTSTLTFNNFPKNDGEVIFDEVFDPKVMNRIFPFYLSGGSNDANDSACLETFGHVVKLVTDDEYAQLDNFLRNHKYYEVNCKQELDAKPEIRDLSLEYNFKNPRWQRNWETLCNRLKLYAESIEEFRSLELLLYTMHRNYVTYAKEKIRASQEVKTVDPSITFEKFNKIDQELL